MTITFSEAIEAYAGADASVCYDPTGTTYTVDDAVISSSINSYESFNWIVIEVKAL